MNDIEGSKVFLVSHVHCAVQLLEEGGVWQVLGVSLCVEVDEDVVFVHHTLHHVDEVRYRLEGEGGREEGGVGGREGGGVYRHANPKRDPSHLIQVYFGGWEVFPYKHHYLSAHIVQTSLVKRPKVCQILKVFCSGTTHILLVAGEGERVPNSQACSSYIFFWFSSSVGTLVLICCFLSLSKSALMAENG